MQRLDIYLSSGQFGDFSRSYIAKLISGGHVIVNGKSAKKAGQLVSEDDIVRLEIPEPQKLNLESEDISLDVVYEDGDLLVVNKPRGMVVHPAKSHSKGTLVNALLYRSEIRGDALSAIGGVIRPGIVHRLDKDTSGLIMVAKTDSAHRSLSKQLQEHKIDKYYIALAERSCPESGIIDAPINRDPKNRIKMKVKEGGRPALTHFNTIINYSDFSLVLLKLETGRTHQIRVHMSHIGHPIIGDQNYSDPKRFISKLNNSAAIKVLKAGQFLHAISLKFNHPRTGEIIKLKTEVPEYFSLFIEAYTGYRPDYSSISL